MLQEILLSLSGHPSPLLRYASNPTAYSHPPNSSIRALSPPELAILASLAHISDLHINLVHSTSQIASSSPSSIIRAVATAVDTLHLGAFRQKVLDVEESLLRKDAGLVGAYNIVPLTAVVGEFEPWRRRDFFLLGRGEFAMALVQQADEKIRSRWRRAENLAYDNKKKDGLRTVVLKEGEVSAVLARTWAALGSMQEQHADEDHGMELARDLLRLTLEKSKALSTSGEDTALGVISSSPFQNLLFSVPVRMTLQMPPSMDLFLGQSDLAIYTAINAYLLSIRRAHIRLTDLWKMTSLRRHHPPPPYGAGREKTRSLRDRHITRENALRSTWATSSAAIFFLAETESYLQTEVVAGLWDGLFNWIMTGNDDQRPERHRVKHDVSLPARNIEGEDDIWMAAASNSSSQFNYTTQQNLDARSSTPDHDPQSLSQAHRTYLRALVHRLLLSHRSFTETLYDLLVHVDRLVALVTRLQAVWAAADLQEDMGVVDAFINHEQEERQVLRDLSIVEKKIRDGVEAVVAVLRGLEGGRGRLVVDIADDGGNSTGHGGNGDMEPKEEGTYVPRAVGGVDRLLMKLDFGSWFAVAGEDDGL
ncbi:hypothetical protein DL546_005424 [Coniochaeta pulveracea]|uniref:Spindle pole body component n=1 Tax=Coniochaeta pulveracea TaxID=177199 RepID=A0A420Y2V7_9PEZI|nr:hypothetical protein DL546_005424 [Coniochaeta pulveracea]